MPININAVQNLQLEEVKKADKARTHEEMPARFRTLREVMLMLHSEWSDLNEEVRRNGKSADEARHVLHRMVRIAAVCSKAVADLADPRDVESIRLYLNSHKNATADYLAKAHLEKEQ